MSFDLSKLNNFNIKSLTNASCNPIGMNMLGGGYNFGSIFAGGLFGSNSIMGGCNNGLFTDCYGNVKTKTLLGFTLGSFGFNILGSVANHFITEAKTNGIKGTEANINDINNQINAELDKIGDGINENNYSAHRVRNEAWYKKDVLAINKQKTAAEAKILDATTLAANQKTISDYEALQKQVDAETDSNKKAQLQTQLDALKSGKEAAEKAINEHNLAKIELEEITLKEEELEAKADSEQQIVNQICDNIDALIEERKQLEKNLDKKILNKADGYSFTRNKKLDVNTIEKNHENFTKADIQQIVYQFSRQPEGSPEKRKYAEALTNLEPTQFMNIATETQAKVLEMAIKYLKTHA